MTLLLKMHDYILSAEAYTVRLMLALLGIPYEKIAVDAYPGGGRVPVLEDGETTLADAGLILTYLARAHGPRWLPIDGSAAISHWLAFAALDLGALNDARRITVLGQAGDLDAALARGRSALRRLEDTLTERRLAGLDWLAADGPTIADIAVFPPIMLSHDSGIGHEDYPAIHLWQRQVRKLPGFIGMPGIPDYF